MINQARIDSLVVSDEEIEAEIDKRLSYFESQLGSAKKVEDYFGKSIDRLNGQVNQSVLSLHNRKLQDYPFFNPK